MRATGLRVFLYMLIAFAAVHAEIPAAHAVNKRVALVIANAEYAYTKPLRNPVNDANLIASKLHDLGFEVQIERELNAKGFSQAIQTFSSKLDKNTDALFYYAGHGLQFRGENYLVGIDAKLQSEATIQFETFRLNTVISLLETKAGTTLIFWDGCRNNPLADRLLQSASDSVSESSSAVRAGSAPVAPRRGDTLVVYSAESGKFALDGRGNWSPFAEALAKHIATPDLEVETMLKLVTAEVLEATKAYQRPERLSQLTKDFYFRREEKARNAYEEELANLRGQLAQLRRPASEKRFTFVAPQQTERKTSPLTTASTSPAAARGAGYPVTSIPQEISSASIPQEIPSASTNEPDVGQSGIVVTVNTLRSAIVRKLRISPSGKLLAVGGEDGIVRIVSLDTFEVIRAIHAHTGRISDLDFTPDNKTLLSAGRDGLLRFWNPITGQKVMEDLQIRGSVPYSARVNPEFPRFVLMGDKAGRLFAWDLNHNRRLITNAEFHKGPVFSVAYQPGGKGTFLSAGGDGLLKIRLPSGTRFVVHAHNGPVFNTGYSSNGAFIYTAGMDRKIKIWESSNLARGYPKMILMGHLKYVISANLSPDDKTLVTGGGDKAINLWDLASRKLIGRLVGHTNDIEALAFTPNGRFIVSASEDKSVKIWSVDDLNELVRLFFKNGSEKYAGVTYDNQSFGDLDSGLMSVFVDGRAVSDEEALRSVKYIGHGIPIVVGDSESR
jgi:WD40 repeat protein/uncharacterized caspase-like protein